MTDLEDKEEELKKRAALKDRKLTEARARTGSRKLKQEELIKIEEQVEDEFEAMAFGVEKMEIEEERNDDVNNPPPPDNPKPKDFPFLDSNSASPDAFLVSLRFRECFYLINSILLGIEEYGRLCFRGLLLPLFC